MKRLLLCLFSSSLVISCGKDRTFESYGLPIVEIQMHEDRKEAFINDFRGGVEYEAEIRINGQENSGSISPAGATSISLYKKSIDCDIAKGSREWVGKSFRLSAQKTDNSLLRSIVGFELYRRLGMPVPKVEPVVVYLNDEFWGLYIKIERINRDFFDDRDLDVDFLYKADNGAAFDKVTFQRPNSVFDVKIGDKNFEFVKQLAYLLEYPSNPRNRETIQKMVDIDSVRRLTRGIALVSHWDSVFNNFHLYRLKGGKKFYALAWDLDAIFDLAGHPFGPAYVEIGFNRLFQYAIQSDLNGHLSQIRSDLTAHFSGATMDAVALPQIERMRAAYSADPVLGGTGLQIETEYAKFRADALSWWNSLDQFLTSRGF